MKIIAASFAAFSLAFSLSAQDAPLNMSLVGHIDYNALHQTGLNDCWGYVDETGIEYALIGTRDGVSVVSLQNPAHPVEVFWMPGSNSIWRDLGVWEDRLYVTTEAQDGLKIIDLSPLPQSNVLPVHTYTGPANAPWHSAHDVFVDEQGYAYILGANRGNGGVIILDVATDPDSPSEVGVFDNWYCHDSFARGNRLYNAHISDGFFSIVDITDRSAPVLINTQATPNTFTHNIWPTSNEDYVVTTDEVSGSYLTFYDISDPMNIVEVDRVRSSPGFNTIPHNAFFRTDSQVVSSYYTDGVTIHNASRPHNVVQTGSFDTHPMKNGTFNGCWGVYPFLPSGLIIATDMSQGMFILNQNAVSPCYYEGLVRDSGTQDPLDNVTVTIQNDPQTDRTDLTGEFGVGTVVSGTKEVTFSRVEYYSQTVSVPFVNGQLVLDTIDLVKLPSFQLTIKVIEEGTGDPVINANVRLTRPEITVEGVTDGFGEYQVTLYYPGTTFLATGLWEYVTHCSNYQIDENTGTLTIELKKGYYDDFTFDNGWTATNFGAEAGLWERAIPAGSEFSATTPYDADYDCGDYAWVTGNGTLKESKYDDVSDGKVVLRSPLFDLTGETDPWMHFSTWFHCAAGPYAPEDTMIVYLTNGLGHKVAVDYSLPNYLNYDQWISKSFRVADLITMTANMQVIVEVADELPRMNVTEGGFDHFYISDRNELGTEEAVAKELRLIPNPASDFVSVYGLENESPFSVLSADGRQVQSGVIVPGQSLDVRMLPAGIYLLEIESGIFRFIKE